MPLKAPKSPQSQADWDRWARNVPVEPDPGSTGSDQIKDFAVTEPKHATGGVSTRALAGKAVTPDKMSDANALTVFGNPLATDGTRADIALNADGKFVVRRANQIVGDTLVDADIPASIARDSEVTAAANAAQAAAVATAANALAAHVAAADPHPDYLTQTEGDARYLQQTLTLTNAVDDAAAAGAGVAIGHLYRNGSVVMIRVT